MSHMRHADESHARTCGVTAQGGDLRVWWGGEEREASTPDKLVPLPPAWSRPSVRAPSGRYCSVQETSFQGQLPTAYKVKFERPFPASLLSISLCVCPRLLPASARCPPPAISSLHTCT